MRRCLPVLAIATALALACSPAPPPSPDTAALRAELDALRERVDAAGPATAGSTQPCPAVEPVAGTDPYAVDRLTELEAENAALVADLTAARADAARYRSGLEEAVAQLNALGAATPRRAYAPLDRPSSREQPRVRTVSAPYVQVVGNTIIVTGKLYNYSEVDAVGTMDVEVLRDGRELASRSVPLDVPAGTDVAYSESFDTAMPDGVYSARVRLHPEPRL